MIETESNYDEIVEFARNNSCLNVGMAGCGKTYMIQHINNKETDMIFCFTNKACDVLRKRGITNVMTFDSFFIEQQGLKKQLERLRKYKNIIVDEFSMVPSRFYTLLYRVKNEVKIKLFGDPKQCKPVEKSGKWYDYMSSCGLIRELTDYNEVRLSYKFGYSRYDRTLYDEIEYLLRKQKLSKKWREKGIDTPRLINICYTNKKREKVNAECFEKFMNDNETKKIGKKQWYVGMPIIAYENMKQYHNIFNSQRYFIKEFRDSEVVIYDDSDFEKTVPNKEFRKCFDYGFCATVYKWQGSSINDDFNIYEIGRMSLNELYTSISRGTSFDKVHLQYTSKEFKWDTPPTDIRELELVKPKLLTGRIYKIIDSQTKKLGYVGSTFKTEQERLTEHLDNPVNEKMAKWLSTNKVKIEVIEEILTLNEKELEAVENEWIERLKPPFNVKNLGSNMKNEPKIQIVQDRHISKFKITDDTERKRLRIQYRDTNNGKMICKEIGYSRCGMEKALKRIEHMRAEFMKRNY